MTDLGALPGGSNSAAFVIDERGDILGGSENGLIDSVSGLPENIGVLWKDGQIFSLGTLGGGFSAGIAINHRGQIGGFAQNAISDLYSMRRKRDELPDIYLGRKHNCRGSGRLEHS
jgi:uncharacterized membrane protein